MRIHFKVMTTELKGLEFETEKASVTIGRSARCDLVLDQKSVSREHGRITAEDNSLLLEDLGSRNSTTLHGEKVTEPVPLTSGDVVSFGEVVVQVNLPDAAVTGTQDDEETPALPELAGQARPAPAAVPARVAGRERPEEARSRWLALVLALGATCLLAIYFILQGGTGPEPVREYPMTVRVGEEKVVMVPKGFVRRPEYEQEGLLEVGRPMNLDRAVQLTGLSEGFTSVKLFDERGRFITFHTRVLPRRRPQGEALPEDRPLTDEQRTRLAVKLMKEGDQLKEQSELYRAMHRYERALSVLEPFARRPNTEYVQAKIRYDAARREVEARFDELTREMGDFIKVGDKRTALRRLEEIKELIPDDKDVRRQNADLLFRLLEAAIRKEQEAEGRRR